MHAAIEASRAAFSQAGNGQTVVLARADVYPDALSGAPLARQVEVDLRAVGVGDIRRIGGASRFDTARLVAKDAGGSEVFVTEGANDDPARGWPDTVAVSGLAAASGRPILLVTRDRLPVETREALVGLQPTAVYVVGGPSAVSEAAASQIAGLGGDGGTVRVERLAGSAPCT